MKRAITWVFCLFAWLPWPPVARADGPSSPTPTPSPNAGCVSDQCHPKLKPRPNHPPPKGHDDCVRCHQKGGQQTATHPQAGAAPFILDKTACLSCHQGVSDYDYLHPPVAAGDCLACHQFHSPNPALLPDTKGQPICYKCHQPVVGPQDTHLHGDVAQQKCASCHTVHGSFFKHLLTGPYSTEFFNDFNEKQYALCFQCHKIDLLLYPTTSYNTKFRDGEKNLHYVHVNRVTRGRGCKFCHKTHASQEPKLMRKTVSFGDWKMPLNFRLTPNGGQCTPGCHAQRSYNRDRPSDTSEATPPPKPQTLPEAKSNQEAAPQPPSP